MGHAPHEIVRATDRERIAADPEAQIYASPSGGRRGTVTASTTRNPIDADNGTASSWKGPTCGVVRGLVLARLANFLEWPHRVRGQGPRGGGAAPTRRPAFPRLSCRATGGAGEIPTPGTTFSMSWARLKLAQHEREWH